MPEAEISLTFQALCKPKHFFLSFFFLSVCKTCFNLKTVTTDGVLMDNSQEVHKCLHKVHELCGLLNEALARPLFPHRAFPRHTWVPVAPSWTSDPCPSYFIWTGMAERAAEHGSAREDVLKLRHQTEEDAALRGGQAPAPAGLQQSRWHSSGCGSGGGHIGREGTRWPQSPS